MENIKPSGIITLTTDFGLDDAYVGVVKGVIIGIFQNATIIDISHNIEPQNIQQASFILRSSVHFFPKGTVHLAVVDPGVGTSRRQILVQTKDYFLVGPDNGIFSDFIKNNAIVFHLNRPEFFLKQISQTFHARDVFAPVAAYLAKGISPEKMGTRINDPKLLSLPAPNYESNKILGQVIHIDRFGNLITNISQEQVPENAVVRILGKEIQGLAKSYDSQKGTLVAIIGSSGFLEISLASDNAARRLKAVVGQAVEVIKPEQ